MINISKYINVCLPATPPSLPEIIEGIVLPDGNTKSEINKLKRATSKNSDVRKYENKPLPGFTLHDVTTKTWSTVEASWVIIDPRGFATKISSKNLMSILRTTGITEGLIQQKCVWVRDDASSDMKLLPISSEQYKEAIVNTTILDAKVNMSDVDIGDTVVLQNGLIGVYRGTMNLHTNMQTSIRNGIKPITMPKRQVIEITPSVFYYSTDAKILSISSKTSIPITLEESIVYINDRINLKKSYFTPYEKLHNFGAGIRMVSTSTAITIKLTEITIGEAIAYFNTSVTDSDRGMLVLTDAHQGQYILDLPWSLQLKTVKPDSFEVQKISKICKDRFYLEDRPKSGYWDQTPSFKLSDFTKFHVVEKHVKKQFYI